MGTGGDISDGLDALAISTSQMGRPHPKATNRDAFNARFEAETGTDLALAAHADALDRFYAEDFPALQGLNGPVAGGREAVQTALALGLRVAIATHPIFPRAAIEERMRWANVHDLPVHVVTSYETMHATKPDPSYYAETAALLGVRPRDAMMVGDDRQLDLAAADIGMRTFYVGNDAAAVSDWRGSLYDVAQLLPRLVPRGR
jgi:FMN phosphatase YigB (HAD superfamily)